MKFDAETECTELRHEIEQLDAYVKKMFKAVQVTLDDLGRMLDSQETLLATLVKLQEELKHK